MNDHETDDFDLEPGSAEPAGFADADPDSNPGPVRRGPLKAFWQEWLKPLLMIIAVMASIRSALADWNDVPTGSMKPTIVEGDRIFVNKLAYDLRLPFTRVRLAEWSDPQRGDIVVLFSPEQGKRLVKRVIGIPGDRVEIRGGRLLVNGEVASYRWLDSDQIDSLPPEERVGYLFAEEELGAIDHLVMVPSQWGLTSGFGPVRVPPERYFVMGDNRSHSHDSRGFGFVERSAIIGQATAVVASLDIENSYRPRWERFFHRIE